MKTELIILFLLIFIISESCHDSVNKRTNDTKKSNFPINNWEMNKAINEIHNLVEIKVIIDNLTQVNCKSSYKFKDIPYFIRTFLDSLTGEFLIANPNEKWESTDVRNIGIIIEQENDLKLKDNALISNKPKQLPNRLLHLFCWNDEIAALVYSKGGFNCSRIIVFFEYHGQEITNIFLTYAKDEIKNKRDLVYYLRFEKYLKLYTDFNDL